MQGRTDGIGRSGGMDKAGAKGASGIAIYTRPGCHLCDEMKATVHQVIDALGEPINVDEIDISSDPELELRFGQEIPVLMVNGRKSAKYRIKATELQRILETWRRGE
jgi:glutaredoxin